MTEAQVVVTGSSRGIGASIAACLGARGIPVVGLSRSGECPVGRAVACDVTDEGAMRAVLGEIAAEGPIGGLVNNAGIHLSAPSHELSVELYEEVMRVNGTSVMVACREAYPHLVAAGGGLIVNIGSFFDKVGVPRQLAYSASKAALGAMTRVLAVEWARDGISVLNVAPGYVKTDFSSFWQRPDSLKWIDKRIPLGRGGDPDEVGRLVALLYAEKIAFLTGETLYIDGAHGINH